MNEQIESIKPEVKQEIEKALNEKVFARKIQKRDEFGLLEGVNYLYTEDGLINWRAMIRPEFLVVNKQRFQNKTIPDSIEGLKDGEILILLGGIRDLANKRGFSKVRHTVTSSCPDYVASVCEITWLPCYENLGQEVTFSAIGDASLKNTNGFGANYLGPIAENRAFVRAVRGFLRISICGADEVSPNAPNNEEGSTESLSTDILTKRMKELGVSFEAIRSKLVEEKVAGAEKFNSPADLPKALQFSIIGRLKKRAEEKVIIAV